MINSMMTEGGSALLVGHVCACAHLKRVACVLKEAGERADSGRAVLEVRWHPLHHWHWHASVGGGWGGWGRGLRWTAFPVTLDLENKAARVAW